jgi:glutamate synthase (ferredoxin)
MGSAAVPICRTRVRMFQPWAASADAPGSPVQDSSSEEALLPRDRTVTRSQPSHTVSLHDHRFEHDSCGVGFVARISGAASHEVLERALEALVRLEHRGAIAADGKSGDGAGVQTQLPKRLFVEEAAQLGCRLATDDAFAVGMVFVPPGDQRSPAALESALASQGLNALGWRNVPVDADQLGDFARASIPHIRQILIAPGGRSSANAFERDLYLARKTYEQGQPHAYVCSLSSQHVVYKALCAPHQLARFYEDLANPGYETAYALYHQRFSTNTLPAWELAQPFRLLAHNGEINTLWANRAWMRSREQELPASVRPVLGEGGSDSADLDAALELLARNGRDVLHALSMLIVPAWENPATLLRPEVVAYYRYQASLMEPWDGPAALVVADGRYVGAALDRNGLRPCRYKVTRDGLVVAGSEVGVVDLDHGDVIEKGRVGPGQIIAVDFDERRVIHDHEIKHRLANQHPYASWVHNWHLEDSQRIPAAIEELLAERDTLARHQQLYGFSRETLSIVLTPMAANGTRATWSMGDDTPIPPLARAQRSLYAFFRQRFAQVTNPAIDPLRESCVTSLTTWLGPRPRLFADGPQPPVLELRTPVLSLGQLDDLRQLEDFPLATVPCVFPPHPDALGPAIDAICASAIDAVRDGASLVLLTDRPVTPTDAPIPMPLAVGAVQRDLVRAGLRTRVGILVESGDCFDEHHLAVLLAYGASAVCPWMALTGARALSRDASGGDDQLGGARTIDALSEGLRKVMSKMGISTATSYRGGQLFDILGLSQDVVDRCFEGTVTPLGGIGFVDIAKPVLDRHREWASAAQPPALPDQGLIRFRRNGEYHAWSPDTVRALQRAVGSQRRRNGGEPTDEDWQTFHASAASPFPANVRDLLQIVPAGRPVPIDQVEPVDAIVHRFVTSAMSLGALSPEAHQTLTIAMNRLGARSNTGEGGEDAASYRPRPDGDSTNNKIKQVASGRFGVTAEYLAHADEIEIKMAQGSKPGEGGQLPGHKVTELIARLRHSQPGVPLISPPPHHDIYSIEDLAQLIHDLKRCSPRARVGVKLVAEAGVGTIAAGVVKAYADYVVISGHSGGTGASPLSSIKHAGSPWELGLAETQQVLMRNGLRGRVRLRVDGGFRIASDVLIAAALGAEEFGFGTAPLVALGCDMARQCHLNTCPTGIATQKQELRAKFRGKPENVVRYFRSLAEDVRRELGRLGLTTLDELVGRVDLLRQTKTDAGLDLSRLLAPIATGARHSSGERNDSPGFKAAIDEAIAAEAVKSVEGDRDFCARLIISNRDRSVGARVAGALAARWGLKPPAGCEVELHFTGSAGQSFGAFATPGMRITLEGEANDYVGKGLSGGVLILRPLGLARNESHHHVIMGNVALYGATGGQLFAAGRAGERLAVRNSGADAVVEGAGDHCCEYMTGGLVVVLGETGVNFGAGMTGGAAYVFDDKGTFPERVNPNHVAWLRCPAEDLDQLKALIVAHERLTGSSRARELLKNWNEAKATFWKVMPAVSTSDGDAALTLRNRRTSQKPGLLSGADLERVTCPASDLGQPSQP